MSALPTVYRSEVEILVDHDRARQRACAVVCGVDDEIAADVVELVVLRVRRNLDGGPCRGSAGVQPLVPDVALAHGPVLKRVPARESDELGCAVIPEPRVCLPTRRCRHRLLVHVEGVGPRASRRSEDARARDSMPREKPWSCLPPCGRDARVDAAKRRTKGGARRWCRRSRHARSAALAGPAAMEAPPSQKRRIPGRRFQSHRAPRLMGPPLGVNQAGACGLRRSRLLSERD